MNVTDIVAHILNPSGAETRLSKFIGVAATVRAKTAPTMMTKHLNIFSKQVSAKGRLRRGLYTIGSSEAGSHFIHQNQSKHGLPSSCPQNPHTASHSMILPIRSMF